MITIRIYMQDGRRFEYDLDTIEEARDHAHRIVNYGWRGDEKEDLVYYPVHQINKVKIIGGAKAAYYPTRDGEEIAEKERQQVAGKDN